jgi:hypothetical protein
LGRRKFGLPAAAVAQFIDGFIAYGVLIAPHPILVGLPDPDDEIFYAVARQCSSQILVTGNARHFPVAMIRPVKALSIRDALALL